MDTMYFSWLPGDPVEVGGVEMPQFTLQNYTLRDCSQSYTAGSYIWFGKVLLFSVNIHANKGHV